MDVFTSFISSKVSIFVCSAIGAAELLGLRVVASYPGPACYQSGAVQEELGGQSASRLRRQIARSLTFQIVTISATATVFRSKSFAKYENIRSKSELSSACFDVRLLKAIRNMKIQVPWETFKNGKH